MRFVIITKHLLTFLCFKNFDFDILLNIYNRLSNVDINGIYSIDEVIYEHELIHKFKYCNE